MRGCGTDVGSDVDTVPCPRKIVEETPPAPRWAGSEAGPKGPASVFVPKCTGCHVFCGRVIVRTTESANKAVTLIVSSEPIAAAPERIFLAAERCQVDSSHC